MADGCQKQSWHEVDILLAVPDRHCLVTGRAFWDFYNSFFLVPRADGHSSDRRSEFAPSVRRSPRRQIGPENQGFHDSPPRPSVLLLYYVCKEGLWRKGGGGCHSARFSHSSSLPIKFTQQNLWCISTYMMKHRAKKSDWDLDLL